MQERHMINPGMTKRKKKLYRLYMVTKHILTEGEHTYFTKDVTTGEP